MLCFNLDIVNNQKEMSRFSLDAELWSRDRSAFDLCWALAQPGLSASHLTDSVCRYQAVADPQMSLSLNLQPKDCVKATGVCQSPTVCSLTPRVLTADPADKSRNLVKCEHQLPYGASWCTRVSVTEPHRLGAAPVVLLHPA